MGNEFKKIANENSNSYVEITEIGKFKVKTGGTNRITLNEDGTGSCVLAIGGSGNYWVNVEDYGVGTGETGADNQTYLTDTITGISAGDVIVIPPGTYTVLGLWTISKACTIMAYGAHLDFATNTTNQGIRVTASDVHIYGLEVEGAQHASSVGTQKGIYAHGTNNSPAAPTYISGLKIIDCHIHSWGFYGIETKYVEKFHITNNKIENIHYAAIMTLSGAEGWLRNNNIKTVVATPNAYGVAVTRVAAGATLTAEPRSKDITFEANHVEGVTNWEGIDTHAGENIKFINNIVIDCRIGIMAGSDNDSHGFKNVLISGNDIVNNSIAAGTVGYGLTAVGDSVNAVISKNAIIADNYIYGYGDNNTALGCAVYIHTIDNVEVANNIIENSGAHAVLLSCNTTNFNIHDNIIDTITSDGITPYGIYTGTGTNSGLVAHNRLDLGSVAGIKLGVNDQTITLLRNDITTSGTKYVNPTYAKDIISIDTDLDMNTQKIVNVVDPTANQHAATKKYVDDNAGGLSNIIEDLTPQLGGNLDMNGKLIGGNSEAQLDDAVSKKHTQGTDTALGAQAENLDMNTHKIVGVVDPTTNQEAATKKYVDDHAGTTSDGTFTPVLSFGGNAVGMTCSLQTAQYTKIGRIVTFSIQIILTNKGSSTGNAVISGLPFASLAGSYSAFSLRLTNISFADFPQGLNATGATTIALEETTNAGAQTALNNNNFANNSTMIISGTYPAQ